MLRGFGLRFVRARDIRHQRHVEKQAVAAAHLGGHLADGFEKGLGFDVAGGAADFRDHHIGGGLFADRIDKGLDFARDMRDNLHRFAQILPGALFVEDIPVYFAGGQIGVFVQIFVDKALVMAEVEVGFCAVLGDEDLAVLERAHGARVDIDIGIKFLRRHFQPAAFEQAAERGGCNAFAKAGDHAAGDENIFGHLGSFPGSSAHKRRWAALLENADLRRPGACPRDL